MTNWFKLYMDWERCWTSKSLILLFVKTMENCSKANEKRCTMPYSMSLYNVGVVTLFISAIINVTNLPVW